MKPKIFLFVVLLAVGVSCRKEPDLTDLSAEVKKASDAGKCFSPADTELKLPKYTTLLNYEQNLSWSVHRWCGYWGRGI